MTGRWWEFLAIFVATATLCTVLTPLAMRFAVRRSLFDHPGGHKSHNTAVPYLGGVAIVLAFAAAVLVVAVLRPPHRGMDELLIVLALGVFLSLVGLLDDLRVLGVGLGAGVHRLRPN